MTLADKLREAVTVLDEEFHREAVARVMLDAADMLEQQQLDLQETRGCVAAWKQEHAHLVRKLEEVKNATKEPSKHETTDNGGGVTRFGGSSIGAIADDYAG